ncbi:MAG: PAS domain-containing protein, partial [Gemmatimonadales bacterium]
MPTSPVQAVSSEGCWRSLNEQGPFLIATFSTEGRLLSLNRTPSGASGEGLIGRSIAELFPLGDGPDTEAALRGVIETGRAARVEIPAGLSDSRMIWLELELLPIREGEVVTGALGLAIDVTETKQTALELRMTVNALHRTIEAREQLASDLHDGTLQSLYGIG